MPLLRVKKATCLILLYLVTTLAIFLWLVLPVIYGGEEIVQVWADSITYHKIFSGEGLLQDRDLVTVESNILGPWLFLYLVNGNPWLVYMMNWIIFLTSFWLIRKYTFVRGWWYLFILMINPITFSSLLAVNKEILSLLVISLLIAYTTSRAGGYAVGSIILSILVRWQLLVFVVFSFLVTSQWKMLSKYRWAVIIMSIIAASMVYPLMAGTFEHLDTIALLGAEDYTEGAGTYPRLLDIQRQFGGYALVVVPKVLHLLFGVLSRYRLVVDFTDFYNNVIVFFQSCAFLFLVILILHKRKIHIREDTIYLAILYCVVFALTPIYSPRYLFPIYVLCTIAVATRNVAGTYRQYYRVRPA